MKVCHLTKITIPASVTSVGVQVFRSWTSSQTIYVEGYASQAAADAAWSSDNYNNWLYECSANIVYRKVFGDLIVVTNTAEWNDALNFIRDSGSNRDIIIIVNGDVAVAGSTNNTFGTATNVSVTLEGNGKLFLNSQGNMIRLVANQTLIIDSENLTLQGRKNGQNGQTVNNNTSLIYVNGTTAKLELRNGTISGNANYTTTSANIHGGGVYVGGGTLTMSGGTISGNATSASANSQNSTTAYAVMGGGVCVDYGGTFRIVNGTIYGSNESDTSLRNTVTSSYQTAPGAALYVETISSGGTAERGTFDTNGEWVNSGTLSTSGNTIRVVNGALQ